MEDFEYRESYVLHGNIFVKEYNFYVKGEYANIRIDASNPGLYELYDWNLYQGFSSNSLQGCMIKGFENYNTYLKESVY